MSLMASECNFQSGEHLSGAASCGWAGVARSFLSFVLFFFSSFLSAEVNIVLSSIQRAHTFLLVSAQLASSRHVAAAQRATERPGSSSLSGWKGKAATRATLRSDSAPPVCAHVCLCAKRKSSQRRCVFLYSLWPSWTPRAACVAALGGCSGETGPGGLVVLSLFLFFFFFPNQMYFLNVPWRLRRTHARTGSIRENIRPHARARTHSGSHHTSLHQRTVQKRNTSYLMTTPLLTRTHTHMHAHTRTHTSTHLNLSKACQTKCFQRKWSSWRSALAQGWTHQMPTFFSLRVNVRALAGVIFFPSSHPRFQKAAYSCRFIFSYQTSDSSKP